MRLIVLLMLFFSLWIGRIEASPEIRINIPELTLRLFDGPTLVKEYSVAVGTPYEPTPTGSFRVFFKEKTPTWYPGSGFADKTPVPPGPDNPLGSRWIEFSPAYGIHGTNKDWSIEYPVSGGCIRMHNADVQELYDIADIGTPVIVTYQSLILVEKPSGLYLKVCPDIYGKKLNTKANFTELFQPYSNRYALVAKFDIPENPAEVYEIKVGSLVGSKRVP